MTKIELEALGLSPDTIRAIQKLHGRDMAKLAAKAPVKDTNTTTREAIKAMLPMLQDSDHLNQVLRRINYLYHLEARKEPETEKEVEA